MSPIHVVVLNIILGAGAYQHVAFERLRMSACNQCRPLFWGLYNILLAALCAQILGFMQILLGANEVHALHINLSIA